MRKGSYPHPGMGPIPRDPGFPIWGGTWNGFRSHLRQRSPGHPLTGPSTFDRMKCNLILVEAGFCRDFGCHTRHKEKTAKYAPIVTAFKAVWGRWNLWPSPSATLAPPSP